MPRSLSKSSVQLVMTVTDAVRGLLGEPKWLHKYVLPVF